MGLRRDASMSYGWMLYRDYLTQMQVCHAEHTCSLLQCLSTGHARLTFVLLELRPLSETHNVHPIFALHAMLYPPHYLSLLSTSSTHTTCVPYPLI